MNPEALPGLLRVPLRWGLNWVLRKSRPVPCPQCQQTFSIPLPLTDLLWDTRVDCPHCGLAMSLPDFGREARTEEELAAAGELAVERPFASRIEVEHTGAERVWHVPAKGGSNFLMLFGAAWLAFCVVFVLLVLFGGGTSRTPDNEMGDVALPVIMGAFVLVGVAMFYAGFMMSRARHTLRLDAVEFSHEKQFLGTRRRKAWPRESITRVKLVVFYQQNYKPVHGIEVRSARGAIRFGSALDAMEKAWLCQDLREALGLASTSSAENDDRAYNTGRTGLEPSSPMILEQNADGCVITLPPPKAAWVAFVVGAVFVAISSVMLLGAFNSACEGGDEWGGHLFDWISSAFMIFWAIGPAIFFIIGTVIVWVAWTSVRTHTWITANAHGIQIGSRTGSREWEETWPAASVENVRLGRAVSSSSKSTEEVACRGVIVLRDRTRGFGGGYDTEELKAAVAALRKALRLEDQPGS